MTLGQYASFSGHLIPGGMGAASPRLANSPGADPIHKEYSQGRTSKQTLDDAGQKWNWSNSNYMFTTFNVSSDDYDKFATDDVAGDGEGEGREDQELTPATAGRNPRRAERKKKA